MLPMISPITFSLRASPRFLSLTAEIQQPSTKIFLDLKSEFGISDN